MTLLAANDIAIGDTLMFDVCVIGGGAAGITLARCLDDTNTRVLLLEAGGLEHDGEAEADSFQVERTGVPHHNPIPSRGRWLGGATNLWFGRIALPDPIDFTERSWVPYSGWPLDPADVDPWLATAAQILDVPFFNKFDVSRWPENATSNAFNEDNNNSLEAFFWANAQDMADTARPILDHSRNVTTITGATVQELVSENGSHISSVRVVGPGGRNFSVSASQFVMAAGGLENPRLLLASTSHSSAGIGNDHDNVGRYYLDHPRGEGLARVDLRGMTPAQSDIFTLLDERADGPFGPTQLRVVFPEAFQRSEELLNHSLHGYVLTDAQASDSFDGYKRIRDRVARRQFTDRADIARDMFSLAKGAPGLAKLALGRDPATSFVVVDQMEHEPDPDSRVTVNHRNLDRFGLPRVTLHWQIGESTRRSQCRMHELFRDTLKASGITSFSSDVLDRPEEDLALIDMKHPSGTTRMSESPNDGVVNSDCRVHGVDNLFVLGSSTFPTTGHFNPTLLIVALAARLADRLTELQR